VLGDFRPQGLQLGLRKILDLRIWPDAGAAANLARTRRAYPVNVPQRYHRVLAFRYVDSRNSGHLLFSVARDRDAEQTLHYSGWRILSKPPSTLSLLVPGFLANHPNHTFAPDDLAISTDAFHRRLNLHDGTPRSTAHQRPIPFRLAFFNRLSY
jgi:hypothetical protein